MPPDHNWEKLQNLKPPSAVNYKTLRCKFSEVLEIVFKFVSNCQELDFNIWESWQMIKIYFIFILSLLKG